MSGDVIRNAEVAPVAEAKDDGRIGFVEFLQTVPPTDRREVRDLGLRKHGFADHLNNADLPLYCPVCEVVQNFQAGFYMVNLAAGKGATDHYSYTCRNCRCAHKTFSLRWRSSTEDPIVGEVMKIAETPEFGPPLRGRVVKLLEGDQENLRRGYRSELQGLGVGAYSYYRRVVENTKDRIFADIIKVAETLNAPAELMQDLRTAAKEQQFVKAVEKIKHGIPDALRVDRHNPLTLLHDVLSEGIHDRSDSECLELAQSIRIVLTDLADKAGSVLKDQAELKKAVSALVNAKNP